MEYEKEIELIVDRILFNLEEIKRLLPFAELHIPYVEELLRSLQEDSDLLRELLEHKRRR